jgi:hypothetical protein
LYAGLLGQGFLYAGIILLSCAIPLLCLVEQFLLSELTSSSAEQLAKFVNELPRKPLVFLTYHDYDHIDGMDSLKLINTK